jgi:hypothetical protein
LLLSFHVCCFPTLGHTHGQSLQAQHSQLVAKEHLADEQTRLALRSRTPCFRCEQNRRSDRDGQLDCSAKVKEAGEHCSGATTADPRACQNSNSSGGFLVSAQEVRRHGGEIGHHAGSTCVVFPRYCLWSEIVRELGRKLSYASHDKRWISHERLNVHTSCRCLHTAFDPYAEMLVQF